MDKTDKQMLLLMLGAVVVIVALGFFVRFQLSPNGNSSLFVTTRPTVLPVIDQTKKYEATIQTSEGTFVIDLDPKSAPNIIYNMRDLASSGFYSDSKFHAYDDTQGVFLGLNRNGADANLNLSEDMNAVYLDLNKDKVQDIANQLTTHTENKYRITDVTSNYSLSLKEFNEKYFGIAYSSNVDTKRIKKYSLVSRYTGNKNIGSEMFITTTENNRYLDGRKVHIGDIISGTNVIDAIITKPINSVTINSISISEKSL